jgi:hypothetical protein
MKEIRLKVQCVDNEDHAKILELRHLPYPHDPDLALRNPDDWFPFVRYAGAQLAALIDGSSPMYIHPPGEGSPIGRCALCQGKLKCTVEEIER